MISSTQEVTALLLAWGQGDATALEKLTPLVYQELHRLARGYMRGERPEHLLQTTALVNEAYLRLIDQEKTDWKNRAHFFAFSAHLMRQILVDFARAQRNLKRGGAVQKVALDEALDFAKLPEADLVALDDALTALAKVDPRKSRVIELRFFGGLSVEETAEALRVSPDTVMRDWRLAKMWLLREISKEGKDEA